MEGPPLGPGGEDITWPDQVAPRGRKASSTRKIKPQTSNHSGNSPPETMGHVGTTLFATFASGHTLNSEIPGSKRIATNGYHFIRHGQEFLGEAGTTTLHTNDEMPSKVMGAVPLVC